MCGRCLTKTPPYDKARYGVYYEQFVRAGVTRLKFHASLFNVRPIAELLISAFYMHYPDEKFDAIIPVPVHRKRLVGRGFNQVITISERLSKETGIVLDRTPLVKSRDTEPQVGLSRARRLVNLKNAFKVSCAEKISNKRILIVDDVSTTGSNCIRGRKSCQESRGRLCRRNGSSFKNKNHSAQSDI